ncbi:hypothetical protein LMG23992_03262 [Cupriavidus laharis]|uniref:Glycoside hydrolase family 19 catalytic domain-containing protein n=1 Tax=Cupriavidus laharis TaxID=151654 RepID=A0ABN7YVI2_9BURK|nr:glycoside hydrolase family 19 protein [Cupriavidus laharis]CAG9176391.1 hypothetical protein LMG23992_03262 [Cupriavidus laharis]
MAKNTPTNPPNPPLRPLRFAFPFRKKAEGEGKNPVEITDENEFHKLLKKEPSGSYSVSSKGMWHGGIHITEAGAGRSLDIKGGVRCIADGEIVAWRMNRSYPVSELPAQAGQPAITAPYSTGFALVRHAMEFPRGTKLTLFSLYMHLQDFEGYESEKTLPRPPYWVPEFKVSEFARDKPSASPHGRAAPADQQGLRIRATHPHGTPLCILPHGTQFSISERTGDWGKIKDTHGAQPYPPQAGGFVAPAAPIGGWAFLGKEHGGKVVEEIMPDTSLDQVVIPPTPVKVKAGDLIGHLGRYDSLNQRTSNRMVHIEVFCGDDIKPFLQKGRAWIAEHASRPQDWKELGLPSEPTILRVAKGTKLYREAFNEGQDAPRTDVTLVATLAELGKRPNNPRTETTPGNDSLKQNWWKVDGANMLHNDISGWVREQNFTGGRVTREFAQSWIDFDTFEDAHDPTHTMFATTKAYVDYVMGANVPEPGALGKLSPLMAKVYRAIYSTGDGSRAADELCDAANSPWRALRMSRLIIKHETEWAKPAKWQQLIQEIERQTGVKPQHEAEKRRIEKLVWWDEVKRGVSNLPASDVFHIHPIGLVGNFKVEGLVCVHCGSDLSVTPEVLKEIFPNISNDNAEKFSPIINEIFKKYEINTCNRVSHFFGQCEVECTGFTAFRESLYYTSGDRLWGTYPTALKAGLHRLHPRWTPSQIEDYSKNNLTHNDSELGEVLFGDDGYPGRDYRGRGLLHMTWLATYKEYKRASGNDVVIDPSRVQNEPYIATDSSVWFWSSRSINGYADANDVKGVTRVINPALKDFDRRRVAAKRSFDRLNNGRQPCLLNWDANLTAEKGW